ncbi:MAG TPA: hypothetical protein DCR97_11150 [Deltaproteobacteria bacterium]|nr:hypothetical protein [Deltaproteobacteria bacterium]
MIILCLLGRTILVFLKQDPERRRRVETTLSVMVLSFAGRRKSRDLISFISSSSFLGEEPSPDAFIHWCRVRFSVKARKWSRI